ncbi:MAG: extracellular substrate binding-like orphan protein GrrP [Cyanobacteriota bacterium]|nr:extracellular substrate binding-like orphan protein GrrP [Cyanobacteriota bacterium]
MPLLAVLGLASALLAPAAQAETVVERAARTGVITIGTRTNLIPYAYVDDKQQLVGVSVDVAERIAKEVSSYLQKPVRLEFRPVTSTEELYKLVSGGEVDLACGIPFTWQQEMVVDYSVPFSLSGIRLLTKGGMKASPEALGGKRIGVIPGSLGEATIRSLQPAAVRLPQKDLETGVAAVIGGRLDGMAGDSILLAGALAPYAKTFKTTQAYELVPREAYGRYAVGCIVPENNSTFRNLADVAIVGLLQGYLDDDAPSVAAVNRWFGPQGIVQLPSDMVRAYFEAVLLTHERLAPGTARTTVATPSPAAAPAAPARP